jgi:putative intracellular protease/amidase
MLPSKSVLFVLTSSNPQFWGKLRTGFFWPELAHPYQILTNAGLNIDFVSLTGDGHVDEVSIPHQSYGDGETDNHGNDSFSAHLYYDVDSPLSNWKSKIQKPEDVDVEKYAGILFVGGHGTLWDFPIATSLHRIAGQIYSAGGFIAAVCHGPSAIAGIMDSDGTTPLIRGKSVTGFCEARERTFGTVERLHSLGLKLTDEILKQAGAHYDEGPPLEPDPNAPHVVVDGRIVTGKNPKSSEGVAHAVLQILSNDQLVRDT